ncbi:hypothetical protein [Halobellus ruber]|uniref:Uncharacterized protein n=1 Tax=Halobellus ruber TaxID=2761102 RepID=A0A7J9SFK5_9EURY|nr:hypothetical protein [Halobellus ruber]MBB6644899.1 hypothetical protein [Halobellus ruber]
MSQEHEHDARTADVSPVGASLAGGFLGTVTGLRKSGVGGAVVGGLVGGTVGYVAGAAVDTSSPLAPSTDVEPISISTDGDDDAADEADDDAADEADDEADDDVADEADDDVADEANDDADDEADDDVADEADEGDE